jgi:AraC-like DNA-binding protein
MKCVQAESWATCSKLGGSVRAVRAATLEEFLAAPIGRWTHAAPLTAWVATPTLCGLAYSGFISSADVPRLRELGTLPFHGALQRPYRAILDCGAVTGVDAAAFAFLLEHTRDIASTAGLVDRVAYVRPAGMTAAMAVGVFHDHLSSTMQLHFVGTLDEAIEHVEGEAHREEIEAVMRETEDSTLIIALRRMLLEDPRRTLDTVARDLKVSTRSLQRACLAAETTFRDEVANARFAFSEQLLRATDDKIDTIARRAGYASSAAFARRFQQVHGVTPTQFRAKRTPG